MRNITLIGMAGVGKSAVGSALAALTGATYIDIDAVIEREEGEPLQAVLERLGDARFIMREAAAVLALAGLENAVISTGGSIVYADEAMEFLQMSSRVVHLHAPLEDIRARIEADARPRGIVGLGRKTLDELYAERLPLYERYAHLTVDASGKNVEDIIKVITGNRIAQEARL